MSVPYTFANQSGLIPLSQLDANFASFGTMGFQDYSSVSITGGSISGASITGGSISGASISSSSATITGGTISEISSFAASGVSSLPFSLTVSGNVAANPNVSLYKTNTTLRSNDIFGSISWYRTLTDTNVLNAASIYVQGSNDSATFSGTLLLFAYTDIVFRTGPSSTARVTIKQSNGYMGLGTSTPSYQLQLNADSAAKPSTNTWTIASDARLKNVTGEYTKGLDAVCQLRPVLYTYNGLAGMPNDGKENISIIAQEAMEHFPECVGTYMGRMNPVDENGKENVAEKEVEIYNWNGHALTFALVNAIKELKAQNEALTARIATLENK